eukprot:Gb_02661 [translate_table: standard]
MYRSSASTVSTRGGSPTGDGGDYVVKLDQVPRWSDAEHRASSVDGSGDSSFSVLSFSDPLTSVSGAENGAEGGSSRFPVDPEINLKVYLWRGNPWNLEVDAVVNSTNEVRDYNRMFDQMRTMLFAESPRCLWTGHYVSSGCDYMGLNN